MSLLTNLVSYWKLDESSGNAADSVGSNTLTNNNTATYSAGKINNGVDLEKSSSQYLSISDGSQSGLDISGDLTLAMWVKLESLPAANQVNCIATKEDFSVAGNRAYAMVLEETNGTTVYKVGARINGTALNSNAYSFTTGVYYHLAMTRVQSSGTVTFYVNGSAEGTAAGTTSALNNSPAAFAIGARFNGASPTDFWDGFVDECSIWSRALSPSEISELYNSGAGNQYPFSIDVSAPLLTITNTFYAPTLSFINPLTVSAPLFDITNTFYAPSLQIGIWSNQSKNSATWTAQTKNTATWTNANKS